MIEQNKPANLKQETAITLNNKNKLVELASKTFSLLDVKKETQKDYGFRIKLFLSFIETNGLNINSFLEFKRNLSQRTDFSISTKNKYLTTAKVFLKELNRQGVLPADITQNTKLFNKGNKHKRDGLNDEEISRLAKAVKQLPNNAENTRLKLILNFLALQGLRQIEIVRLNVNDIDIVNKTALILGKGKDDKEQINLHTETINALKVYLKANKVADGALFVSKSNNSKNNRLTTRTIRNIIGKTLNELGIEKTTHGFRHYFTTKLIKTYKGDLLEVAQYTRHKSLEMLQVYNDSIKRKEDLPRFYKAFSGVGF